MSSSSGGGKIAIAAGGEVKVVHSALEFSLATRSTEPTHIVLADHISFIKEFTEAPANVPAVVDVQVPSSILSIRGNCTTPPSLSALDLDPTDSILELIPGQCMVVVGRLANYKFSSSVWADGVYFKQTHGHQPRPMGGGMHIPENLWFTSCTIDWSSPGDEECPDCPEWLDGGFYVEGGMYVKDSILANFKGVALIETDRGASTTIKDSRIISNTISEAVLTGVHGINGEGSTVYVERCSFEETTGPSIISTRWWQRGHDPVFFCDTELPMYNYDRKQRAVSETFSRPLSDLPDTQRSAVLLAEDPTFLSMQQNLPKIDRGSGVFKNGSPATTVIHGGSLIINRSPVSAPMPESTSVGAIMGFVAAGIACLIILSGIIFMIMRGNARRRQKERATMQLKRAEVGESEQSWGAGGLSTGPGAQADSRKPSLDALDLVAASRPNSTDFHIHAKSGSDGRAASEHRSVHVPGCFARSSSSREEMSADGSERKDCGASSPLHISSAQRCSLSCNGSNHNFRRSSLQAKIGHSADTTSTTAGTLSSYQPGADTAACSPCTSWGPEDVQVTRMHTGGCQMTYQTSNLTTMGPTNTLTKRLSSSSSPGTKLQLQLEWISANRGGHLFDFLKLIPHMGQRTGGQGVVLFAEHAKSPLRQYAIKFFLSKGSFDVEGAAVSNPALREAMPPVARIESDPDALLRPVEGLPEPLNRWPLPPLIVTEKGESLDSFAARSAPDFFTSLQVIMHIARKLEGLHEAGWVHRDLKPGNAIWLPSSNSWTLIDFGSAARIGEKADMAFTVKYAAPETIQGFRNGAETCTADPAVDVWAFGMICFELLTYQKFYGVGTTADEVMNLLTSDELLPSEKALDPHIAGCLGTEAFRESILSMLSRKPASRPTVSQLISTWSQIFPQPPQQPSQPSSQPSSISAVPASNADG